MIRQSDISDIEELLLEAVRNGCQIELSGEWVVYRGGNVPIDLMTLPKDMNNAVPGVYRRMKAEGRLPDGEHSKP